MEKQSFPFVNTPILTTEQLSKWAELFLPTGVVQTGDATVDLNKLEVYADSTGMQVKVKRGKAFMKGHLFWGKTSEEVLAIADVDPTNDRIDRVIAQLVWATGVIDLKVLTGTPAASPVPPPLTTDTAIWEISLAQVAVGAGVSTIAAGDVTDERGFVGPVKVLDEDDFASDSATQPPSQQSVGVWGLPRNAGKLSKTANHTLVAGDNGKIIECDGTFTISLPDGLDDGFQVAIVNIGTGTITLSAITTLTSKDSKTDLANQYGGASVYHAGSNVWRAFGDLS